MPAWSRRRLLGAAAAAPLLGAAVRDDRSLRERAAGRGMLYGAATANYQLKDDDFSAALGRESGILVPEYELKRDKIEPRQGQLEFGPVDALLAYATRHGLKFRGHPLLWHRANPPWLEPAVADRRDERLITDYVTAVARRYRGRMHSWDVVNEAIKPEEGNPGGFRGTFWLKAFGTSYIDTAYHAAREADPLALLVYNDWGCEAGAPANDRFRADTLALLEGMKKRGVPIDALGLQGHLAAFGTPVDQRKLATFLDAVKAMGLGVLVTEHDVYDTDGPKDIESRDRAVADASRRFLDVAANHPATIAVLTWGLSDRYLQPENWRDKLTGFRPRMLPLDDTLARTPMWHAMADVFGA